MKVLKENILKKEEYECNKILLFTELNLARENIFTKSDCECNKK